MLQEKIKQYEEFSKEFYENWLDDIINDDEYSKKTRLVNGKWFARII